MNDQREIYTDLERLHAELLKSRGAAANIDRALLGCVVRAPLRGKVSWITPVSQGAWVTPSAPLARIVPENGKTYVQALLPERDITFIRVGQRAVVKINGLPFVRYGALAGTVVFISPDTLGKDELADAYRIRVLIDPESRLRGAEIVSGMSVRVDIVTGKRRIVEYFLDPVLETMRSSFREQ